MIELRIVKTCMHATTGRNAGWRRYDTDRKYFPDKAAARAWLAEEYRSARRAPMYHDTPDGAKCIGYIIGFRCKYRNPGDAVAEQHWIEFRAVESIAP